MSDESLLDGETDPVSDPVTDPLKAVAHMFNGETPTLVDVCCRLLQYNSWIIAPPALRPGLLLSVAWANGEDAETARLVAENEEKLHYVPRYTLNGEEMKHILDKASSLGGEPRVDMHHDVTMALSDESYRQFIQETNEYVKPEGEA